MPTTAKTPSRVIGHLDLLGAQSLAITDPEGFAENLSDLQAAVQASSSELRSDGAVYLFADCIYFETERLPAALAFAGKVRSRLLNARAFFKCAIAPGVLDAQNFGSGNRRTAQRAQVHGTVFGAGVVPVFQLHNQLRGVGISVSDQFPEVGDDVFPNIYVSSPKSFARFRDLRLSPDIVEDRKQVGDFFENIRQLRVRSRDLPGKYLPVIVNFIRSTNFAKLRLSAANADDRRIPPVMEHLLAGGSGRDALSSLPWFPIVQMALVDQVFKSASDDTLAHPRPTITRILGSISKLPVELDRVPVEVLGPEARRALLKG